MKRIVFVIGFILVFTSTFVYGQETAVEAKSGEKEIDWVKRYQDAFNKGDSNGVYEAAGNIMAQKVSDMAFGQLLKIAKDKSKTTAGEIEFRCMTLEILGVLKYKNEKIFDELKNIIEDKDDVKSVRLFALQQLGGSSKNEKIFTYLISKLNDPDQDIRAKAITKLGEPGNIKAAPYLMPFLNDKDTEIKSAAIVALGTIGYKEATDMIVKNLKADDENIVSASIYALRMMKDDKAIDPLLEILLDKNQKDYIRGSAVEAIKFSGFKNQKVVTALISVVNEGGYESINAAEALGEIGDMTAVESLQRAITRDTDSFALKKYKEAYKKITGKDYVGQK